MYNKFNYFQSTCFLFLCLSSVEIHSAETEKIQKLANVFLGKSRWQFDATDDTVMEINNIGDELKINFKVKNASAVEERGHHKMKKMIRRLIPWILLPGFIMAGVLPWIIPGLKVVIMGLTMINQMAFNASLFAFIRGIIFDKPKEDHVVYINSGYKRRRYQQVGRR